MTRSIVVDCLLAAALAGCGANNSLSVTTADGDVGGSGGGGAIATGSAGGGAAGNAGGDDGGAGAAPVATSGACSAPMGDRVYIDDATAIMAALPGTWMRCGHALTSNEAEMGIQISADGRFALLVPAADGSATPSTSLLEKGQVMMTPLGPFNGHLNLRLEFATEANLTYETEPFFTNGMPLELVTLNTDIFWLRYVRVDR